MPAIFIFLFFAAICRGYDTTAFSNLAYPIEDAPGGQAILKNGSFSKLIVEGSAARFDAKLLEPVAISSWRGRQVAAVVLYYSSGGSGNFRRLFFLTKDEKGWSPKAWADLGDRIKVRYLGLERHGEVTVGMITHATGDPRCCPTKKIVRVYIVKRDKLLPKKTASTEIFPDQVHFAAHILPEQIKAILIPEHGVSAHGINNLPPYPSHVALLMNGKVAVRIMPVKAYEKMWLKKNDLTIKIAMKRIERIITGKEKDFSPPLPILPPHSGINDLAAKQELIKWNSGQGIGFIGRIAKTFSCVSPDDLCYFFTGISNGNRFLISLIHNLKIKEAPNSLWSCESTIKGLSKQIKEVSTAIGGMHDDNFEPSLSAIRRFLSSISIEED